MTFPIDMTTELDKYLVSQVCVHGPTEIV